MKKLLILCSGGNAPGMKECVDKFFKLCNQYDIEVFMARHGLKDIYDNKIEKINNKNVKEVGCGRFEKFKDVKHQRKIIDNIKSSKMDAVIIIGGEGSYKAGIELIKNGVNLFFIPCSIDNDVEWTDYCLGFNSAVEEIVRCCKILDNAYIMHQGINFVEVMGRDCTDIALNVGKQVKADCVITKDNKLSKQDIVKICNKAFNNNAKLARFIVQENTYDKVGSESLRLIKEYVKKKTGRYCELDIIGHLQRGAKISRKDKNLVDKFVKSIFRIIRQEEFNYKVGIVKNKVKLMKINI